MTPPLPAARRDARVHDPSTIVKCGRDYYLYATGRGIASWRSRDLKHWERGPGVFANADSRPAWWQEVVPAFDGTCWAPDVIKLNDHYLLYYSVSAWGKRTSAIGLAVSPTLDPTHKDYRWTDAGIVVRTGDRDDHNAIDPSVCRDSRTGDLWVAYGSFWSGIKAVRLHTKTGLRYEETPPLSLAWHDTIEAACLHQRDRWWYLFVNWGLCCRGVNSTYDIRVGRSDKPTGPFIDKEGRDLRKGGGTPFLSTNAAFIGPGHAGILKDGRRDYLSCHFYDGDNRGTPTLALLPLRWTRDGWPDASY